MGSVQVALIGPTAAVVRARLEEVAGAVGATLSPFNAMAGFETNGSTTLNNITSTLVAQSLSNDELTALLAPFQDETVDTQIGVRFIVSPRT
jgi:hypothetical protein